MDHITYLSKNQLKKHILTWAILIVYVNIDSPFPGSWFATIFGGAIESLNYILVFYILSLYIFPRFWEKQRKYLIFFCIFICYGLYSAVTYFNYLIIIPYLGSYSSHQKHSVYHLLISNIFLFFILCIAATSYFFYQYSIYKFKWHAGKEKSLLVKELNFLKNQFNSHITFNFLNYCYSKIHRKLPETAESIGLFSDMLRYSLQSIPGEKIPVSNEITNIENFIHLHKLLSAQVYAGFSYLGNTKGGFIMPHILITFVENAFKYGVNTEPDAPILINLEVLNNKLLFTVKNKINLNIKQEYGYIENVKQILDLYYPKHYSLTKEENVGFFIITLQLVLEAINDALTQVAPLNSTYGHLPVIKQASKSFKEDSLIELRIDTKPLMHLNKKQIQKHLLIWAFIFAYSNLTDPLPGPWAAQYISSAIIHLNYMFVFYSMGLLVFPILWEGKRILLFAGIILVFLLDCCNSYFNFMKIIPALGGNTYIQTQSLSYFLHETLYYFVMTGLAGIASFFIRYGLYKLKLQAEREKALIVKELTFLKDQFNSHLTFNFLNHCYGNIYPHFPETAESISCFADMLRYTLQTGAAENVTLNKEIIYIENFIDLQRLLSSKVYANFDYIGKIENKHILPRILVTFVENAFKHGRYNDPQQPIQINLKVEDHKLTFTVNNKVNHSKRAENTNKGIENVTQILDLYYTDNYELKKTEENESFCVELMMRLSA